MTNLTVEYKASVNTPAGWRSVSMTATALQVSAKRVEVIQVTKIDGEIVSKNMSRGGAKRQQYDGEYFASQEAGKTKNISSLAVI
tara:strand:+ start:145 stop:399 length:255 start_codon:yes stop_codon:yes gene_type:complete